MLCDENKLIHKLGKESLGGYRFCLHLSIKKKVLI